jgi:tRNA pseudouridine55 synthase
MLMSLNGIIIIDKPMDWTSHDVVAKLRGTLSRNAKTKHRVGHGGTLDPMATGVLPIFIGRATRAAEFCENAEKEYTAGLRLGIVTDTQDITGNILNESDVAVTIDDLRAILPRFMGAQKQIPPMYSAIKQDGKKLYELARRGIDVPREARDIYISELELVDNNFINEHSYVLRAVCSKGTYIRTLCHDIGAALGCGGTLSSLRRNRAGAFTIDMSHTLESVLATILTASDNVEATQQHPIILPVDSLFSKYPSTYLSEAETKKAKNGVDCKTQNNSENGKYRVYASGGEFLLFGKVINGKVQAIKRFF